MLYLYVSDFLQKSPTAIIQSRKTSQMRGFNILGKSAMKIYLSSIASTGCHFRVLKKYIKIYIILTYNIIQYIKKNTYKIKATMETTTIAFQMFIVGYSI